ncbi:helix-turn-helix domain-containing protein [Sphingomonas tabacisoli]|uniref:Helix-turn-helix domain-containing protein n=1 Tax=Sphingomonas tabacisoli TaxID=2249466 RepID=A0ABW4I6V1_9SPHN
MPSIESNKAKIAKRVVEVLEFFDDDHPRATVMDIVRRFNRPQSSTSELLSSLVDLGLLYKDPYSRSYSPTPRAALLACSVQKGMVRDGRLTMLIQRLSAQTGLAVAVFGMVGLNVQIFSWRSGQHPLRSSRSDGLCGGLQDHLSNSAVGQLLLSTVPQPRRDGMIRRLNAEAAPENKFSHAAMAATIQEMRDHGHATGVAGFGSICDVTAVLIPRQPENEPLAIGFVYEPSDRIQTEALRNCLLDGIARTAETAENGAASPHPLFNAA